MIVQEALQPSTGFEILHLAGQVEALEEMQLTTSVAAEVAQIPVSPGSWVETGALLLVLRDGGHHFRLQAAEKAVSAASSAAELAERQRQRMERLVQQGAVSTLQSEQAALAARDAQTALRQAQSQLEAERETMRYLEIRAPFAGQVTEIRAALGSRVAAGQVLGRLVGRSVRTVAVSLPGSWLERLQEARFEVLHRGAWQASEPLSQMGSYQDDGSRWVYLQQLEGMQPLQRLQVRALLPVQGLLLRPGQWEQRGAASFALVQGQQGAVRRLVKLGPALADGRRLVLAGLAQNELLLPVRGGGK
jgi:multidrug efflux pump subunit AcrA (membrane-fusion protein)